MPNLVSKGYETVYEEVGYRGHGSGWAAATASVCIHDTDLGVVAQKRWDDTGLPSDL